MAEENKGFTNQTIASLLEDETDKKILLDLLSGKRIPLKDEADAARVASLFVERATVSIDIEDSLFASTRQDVIQKSLMFSGLNDKGKSYVSDDVADEALDVFLPIAFGGNVNGVNESLFNSDINEAMLSHLHKPDDTGFSDLAKKKMDEFLTLERQKVIYQRAIDGVLESSYGKDELVSSAREMGIEVKLRGSDTSPAPSTNTPSTDTPSADTPSADAPSTGAPNADAPSTDAPSTDAPSTDAPNADAPSTDTPSTDAPNADEPSEEPTARLGTNATRPDAGELAAAAESAHLRYKLDVERRTDALVNLNAIMEKNPTWVNRTVVDKIKTKASNLVDNALGRDTLIYPNESIFGESLSSIDASGRVDKELVKYSNSAVFGFKARFHSATAPSEAFEATAFRLRAEGVRSPYIKTSFRDPNAANTFMKNMVGALVKSGYDLDDIKVSHNLKGFFEAYKQDNHPSFTVGEAPPNVDQLGPENNMTPAERMKNEDTERRYEKNPGLKDAEELAVQLKEINEELLNVDDSVNNPETSVQLSDLDNETMIRILSKVPLLEKSGDTWNEAIAAAGVLPSSRRIVEAVFKDFKDTLGAIDPRALAESGREVGVNQLARVMEAKDVLYEVLPKDVHHHLTRIFDHYEGNDPSQSVDNSTTPINGDETQPDTGTPENTGDAQPETGTPENTGDAQPDTGNPENAGDAQPEAGTPAKPSEESLFGAPPLSSYENNNTEEGPLGEAPPSGDYSDYAEQINAEPAMDDRGFDPSDFMEPVSEEKPNNKNNEEQTNHAEKLSDVNPEDLMEPIKRDGFDGIGDVDNKMNLDRDKWSVLLGKELKDVAPEMISEIANMTPKDKILLNLMSECEGWGFDDLHEVKNTMSTIHLVTDKHIMGPDNLGVRELELLAVMPEELVPENLSETRNKINAASELANVELENDENITHAPSRRR